MATPASYSSAVAAAGSNGLMTEASKMEERAIWTSQVLIGYKVEVQVGLHALQTPSNSWEPAEALVPPLAASQLVSGLVYEGIFNAAEFAEDGINVVLKYARVVRDPSAKTGDKEAMAERPKTTLIVRASELAQLSAKDVRMTPEDLAAADDDFFSTDAAIGRGKGG